MSATNLKQLRRATTCGLLACALAVPAASARPLDGPSYGNYEAVRTSSVVAAVGETRQDLRSPDARDAALRTSSLAGTAGTPRQDLRSPDTRDTATGYAPVAISQEPIGTPDVATPGGFDWSTAGVTAAIVIGLLIVSFAMAVAIRQARRHIPGA